MPCAKYSNIIYGNVANKEIKLKTILIDDIVTNKTIILFVKKFILFLRRLDKNTSKNIGHNETYAIITSLPILSPMLEGITARIEKKVNIKKKKELNSTSIHALFFHN